MPNNLTIVLIASALISGCQYGILPKRQSELRCPTDIRRTMPMCVGEDAVFHCPCKTSSYFYGHKPTCWGQWPAAGSEWRDSFCGCVGQYPVEEGYEILPPGTKPQPETLEPAPAGAVQEPAAATLKPYEAPFEIISPEEAQLVYRQEPKPGGMSTQTALTSPAEQTKLPAADLTGSPSQEVRNFGAGEAPSLVPNMWSGLEFTR